MTLHRAIFWTEDDELVEMTPKTIRLRKLDLDLHANGHTRHSNSSRVA